MSDDPKQAEKLLSELIQDPRVKSGALKTAARREILDNLVSLLAMAYKKSTDTKNSSAVRQRWVTIFGYLSQVSNRMVRDLEYEALRSELDELKKKVLTKDVIRLRRTIYAPRNGARR
jgi:hypothetical protein